MLPWTWRRLIVVTAAKALVAALLGLAAWAALPAAIGWHPTTVSSGSMMPRLHVGDIAVSRPLGAQPPPLGSVLLFDDPDHHGRLRMHRFIDVNPDGLLVTRGDANPQQDSSPIGLGAVVGIGTLRVPWIGLPIIWLRAGSWAPLGLVALAFVVVLVAAAAGRDHGFPDDDDPPEPGDGGAPEVLGPDTVATPAPPSPWARGLARHVTMAAAVVLLLQGAVPAEAAFRSTATNTGNTATAATYFSCANATAAFAPSLWYRMDETSSTTTTATDSSANNLTGVYGSAGKTTTTAKACVRDTGRAMTFDGSSGYLSSPLLSTALPNTFSLSIWFKTTTTSGGKLIGFGSQQTGASGQYDRHLYMTNAGQVIFGVYPSAVKTLTSPKAYNDGAWHLAVATLSTAGMRLYLDGTQVGSDTTVTTGESGGSGYLRIGYDNLDGWTSIPSSRFFAGTLDDAAAFSTALTAAQVQALYQSGTS